MNSKLTFRKLSCYFVTLFAVAMVALCFCPLVHSQTPALNPSGQISPSNQGNTVRLIIEREIDGTWAEMLAPTRDVWIGQRISLRAKMSDGTPITSISWSVPGNRVANYEASQSSTIKTPLVSLSSTSVVFKWYDKGNINVGFSGTSAGRSVNKSFAFNVKKPESYLTVIAGGGDRKVIVTNLWDGDWGIFFGIPSAFGINFKGDITNAVCKLVEQFCELKRLDVVSQSQMQTDGVTQHGS